MYLVNTREEAQKAMQIDPLLAETYILEGIVTFYYDRNSKDALALYEKAIELNPQASDAYRVKAYYHSMVGEFEQALNIIRKAVEMDPFNLNIQLSLGEILYRCNLYNEAIEVLTVFTKNHPDSIIARLILGISYYFNGRH